MASEEVKELAEKTFREVWKEIYQKVWEELIRKDSSLSKVEGQFKKQIESYFSTFSVVIDINGRDYSSAYASLEKKHGALKSFRPYIPRRGVY
ncbi:hypothetical protein JCM9492_05180 [Aquifex pyrophilus]